MNTYDKIFMAICIASVLTMLVLIFCSCSCATYNGVQWENRHRNKATLIRMSTDKQQHIVKE